MDLRLRNRTAVVTGSSAGIGRSIALQLAAAGATVVIHGRDEGRTRAVADEIVASGGRGEVAIGALDTDRGAAAVLAEIERVVDTVDILVNNAGGFEVCNWWNGSPDRWMETFNVTVASTVRMVQGLVPRMRDGGWGRVVQVASVSATLAPPVFPDYAAAKAAILNLTLTLAKELAGTGVTVNTVSPGPTVTPTWESFARQIGAAQGWDNDLDRIKSTLLAGPMANPSGRLGTPEDVAAAVAFLASDRAGYINGVNLKIDGGLDATLG